MLGRMSKHDTNEDDVEQQADVGAIGEGMLAVWAAEVFVAANRVQVDRTGWDFLLEVPRPRGKGGDAAALWFLDRRPPEMSCFVQVKTTRDLASPINVKLSNWERLAKAVMPAFFVVVEIGDDNKARRAFVVHVDAEWIGKVLKRLRAAKDDGAATLHKRTMQLTWKAEEELPALTGAALVEALRSSVGGDLAQYVTKKIEAVATVGYDEARFKVTFSFPDLEPSDLQESMADFAIGRIKRLPISAYRASEVRFGIERPLRDIGQPLEGFVEVPTLPSVAESTVEVVAADDVVSFDCKTYLATTLFPFLPPEHQKVSLVHPALTLVITPPKDAASEPTVVFKITLPEPGVVQRLHDGVDAARVLRLLSAPPSSGVKLRISFGGPPLELPAASTHSEQSAPTLAYAASIEMASLVATAFGLPQNLELDPDTLPDQSRQLALLNWAARPGQEIQIATLLDPQPDAPEAVRSAAILMAPLVELGNRVLLVVVAIIGTPRWENGTGGRRMVLNSKSPRVMAKKIYGPDEDIDTSQMLEEARAQLTAEGVELVAKPK